MQRAKKSFGQNWLVDETAVKKLIDSAELKKGERVLEIGPGTGIITKALIDAGADVISIEFDHELIAPLQEKFGNAFELIEGDALALLPDQYPKKPYKLVSSIPYNITSDILKTFLTTPNPPVMLCLVVQKEVAQRMCAKPPQMSLLAVVCQLYAKCEYVDTIKAGAFRPIPKVDSAVVKLTRYPSGHPSLGSLDAEQVIRIAKLGFSSKRKQLQKNLASLPADKWSVDVKSTLQELGISQDVRAENLTVDEWIKLVGKMRGV